MTNIPKRFTFFFPYPLFYNMDRSGVNEGGGRGGGLYLKHQVLSYYKEVCISGFLGFQIVYILTYSCINYGLNNEIHTRVLVLSMLHILSQKDLQIYRIQDINVPF